MSYVVFIFAIIYVEAVTELLVNGAIFDTARDKLLSLGGPFAILVTCGYCLSVWVSMTVAWLFPIGFNAVINFIIMTFVIHRLSNMYHELMVRWLNRIPWTIQLNKIETVIINEENNE